MLLGVVPIASAVIGAICTVVVQRWFGTSGADAMAAVASATGLTPADKLKAFEAINKNDQQFYDLVRSVLLYLTAPMMVIAMSVGSRLRG